MSLVARVDDLDDDVVDRLLARAEALRAGSPPADCRGRVVSLLFLDTSLRTRAGFAAAAARLGAATVTVDETRGNAVSMPESWQDTLRVLAGYSDASVVRVRHDWADEPVPPAVTIPVISGGDVGARAEHPSQALVDIFAMQTLVGPVAGLHVAVVGDPRMRAVRSLLSLLARRPPARLTLVTEPALCGDELLESGSSLGRATLDELTATADVDVLYVAGIPHLALPEEARSRLRVGVRHLECLTPRGGVFSPLPVIDEWEAPVADEPRQRAWDQSDLALFVRMAVLEWALPAGGGQRIS